MTGIADPETMLGFVAMLIADNPDPQFQALVFEIDKVLETQPIPELLRRFTS